MPCSKDLEVSSRLLFLLLLASFLAHRVHSLPLSTSGRWIVDSVSWRRVKLHCVNWAAHMPAVLAEGLDKQPLDGIAARVAGLGFNCVRLTWATQLFTNESYAELTVAESLSSLGLAGARDGVRRSNRWMAGMTVREAYDAVVEAIGKAGLMVVLDNHVSRPQWCCGDADGNGFFGDAYFDAEEWVHGLESVAARYRGTPQVVGMSMRNELRGPNQSEAAWYLNIARGAQKIHDANPNVLIIVSGLSYDTDLSFLKNRPLDSNFDRKLVLEAHRYAFSQGLREAWARQPPNRVCSETLQRFEEQAGFVARDETGRALAPLFVSEFGVDQRGANRADNRFLSCFLAYAAERDLDWALWALQGSYYLRQGIPGFNETYGVLDSNWDRPKNPRLQEKLGLIQEMLQDPRSSTGTYQIIYHPLSGQCLSVDDGNNIVLSDCKQRKRWSYSGNRTAVWLVGSEHCLRVEGKGLPVLLSTSCDDDRSVWGATSRGGGFQLSGMDAQGMHLCLERNSSDSNSIFTGECLCLDDLSCSKDTRKQWFHFISSNVD